MSCLKGQELVFVSDKCLAIEKKESWGFSGMSTKMHEHESHGLKLANLVYSKGTNDLLCSQLRKNSLALPQAQQKHMQHTHKNEKQILQKGTCIMTI